MNLAVELSGLRFKNPLIAASGTFGYGGEYEGVLDLSHALSALAPASAAESRRGAARARPS